MNLLHILVSCSSPELAIVLGVVKRLLNLIQMLGPVLLICSLVYSFIKLMQNPDEKKLKSRIKNSALALVIIFFVPLLVDVVMKMTDGAFQVSTCWNQNTSVNLSPSYIQTKNDSNRKDIIGNESDYEKGTPKPSPSSNNNSNNNNSNQGNNNQSDSSYNNTPLPSEGIISGDLEIHFIDPSSRVDAIYIKAGSRSIFVDGGYKRDGQREIAYLKKIGVTKIDYYIGTHAHKNHVEAAPSVINTFGIKNVLVGRETCNGSGSTPCSWYMIKKYADAQSINLNGVNARTLKPGDTFSLGGLKITCIGPSTVNNNLNSGDTGQNYNSLLLILEYGSVSVALTGDNSSSSHTKNAASAYPNLIKVDVLKNPHHNGNCSDSLYKAYNPKYVVFTTMDGYLPSSSLLSKLQNLGISKSYIVTNSKDGNVVLSSNGSSINFKTRN